MSSGILPTAISQWSVVTAGMFEAEVRPQLHYNLPGINESTVGSQQIAVSIVLLPPGATAKGHVHHSHETVIVVLDGWSLTFMGPDQEHAVAGPGELLFIPTGVEHLAVNLSTTDPLVAIVCRSDPKLYTALELLPDMNQAVADRIDELRVQHAAGNLPKDWKKRYRQDANLDEWKKVWLKHLEGKPIME